MDRGRERILRNNFLDLGTDRCRTLDAHRCSKLVQLTGEPRPVFWRSAGSFNLCTRCGQDCFMIVKQLFLEFLPFTQTCKLNFDVMPDFSGKTDQVSREVENSHRLAHVQDQNVAMIPNGESL